MTPHSRLFPSFFLGGFECSTHRRHDGRRLDLIDATRHDELAAQDYALLRSIGLDAARDGARWHLIESENHRFDWRSIELQLRAARESGITVIWDVWHYGWPDSIDIWSGEFVHRFARFAREMARVVKNETDGPHWFAPVNEASFFAFAGGTKGFFAPYAQDRGEELKIQLARASVAACAAIREEIPDARLLHTDPLIRVHAHPERPYEEWEADGYNEAQFDVWRMIGGLRNEEIGGAGEFLDVLGANYYVHNQWFHPGGHGSMIPPSHPRHIRLRYLFREMWEKFERPILLAETGIEGDARAAWLRYIAQESRATLQMGVPLGGVCLYPICNHPGWDDERHCLNGLFDYPNERGEREADGAFVDELRLQIETMNRFESADWEERERLVREESDVEGVLDDAARQMEWMATV